MKPLRNDTPERAAVRYRRGGFGKVGSIKAQQRYSNYLARFEGSK